MTSFVHFEGYSDTTGQRIVYRATHLSSGISVTKSAPPCVHTPSRFEQHKLEILSELQGELSRRYLASGRR